MPTVVISPGTKKLPWQPMFLDHIGDQRVVRAVRFIWEEIARFLNNLAFKVIDEEDNYCIEVEDAATITLDAREAMGGKLWYVTIEGDRTITIDHAVCGQAMGLLVKQGTGGSHSLTWDTMFRLGTDLPAIGLSTAVGAVDYVGFIYFEPDDAYDIISLMRGYL